MLISCENCNASYTLSAEELGTNGKKLKCARCGSIWLAKPPASYNTQPKDPTDNVEQNQMQDSEAEKETTEQQHEKQFKDTFEQESTKELSQKSALPIATKIVSTNNSDYSNPILLKFTCFMLFFIALFLPIFIFYPSFYQHDLLRNIYIKFGYSKTENLIISDLSIKKKDNKLFFQGFVYNKGQTSSKMPLLRIRVKDEDSKEIFNHTIENNELIIKSGQKIPIDNNISNLSSKAAVLELDIGNKIELLQR